MSISYRVVVIGEGEGDYAHFVFMKRVDNVIGRQVWNAKDLTNNLTALRKVELLSSTLPEVGFFFLKGERLNKFQKGAKQFYLKE